MECTLLLRISALSIQMKVSRPARSARRELSAISLNWGNCHQSLSGSAVLPTDWLGQVTSHWVLYDYYMDYHRRRRRFECLVGGGIITHIHNCGTAKADAECKWCSNLDPFRLMRLVTPCRLLCNTRVVKMLKRKIRSPTSSLESANKTEINHHSPSMVAVSLRQVVVI